VVLLSVLAGRAAGSAQVARRFPFHIGRATGADLRLEDEGVWDRHAQIDLESPQGFILSAQPDTLVTVGGQPVTTAVLRNGDVLGLGGARIRFALSPTVLRGLGVREALTWIALGALCLGQVALIYWLLAHAGSG
jgi:hypothetical protein